MTADLNTTDTDMTDNVVVQFEQVSKHFGSVVALKGLSLKIRRGEVVGFLGPNGAGKSTSLKLLTGLRRPSAGQVRLFGEDPQSESARRRVGMTPQELEFPPHMKVGEVLAFLALSYGRGTPEIWKDRLDLGRFWARKTQGLSGGEKRRLGLACALIASPDLLLLDEPTTGLDVESRRLLWQVVRDEQKRGVTVLLTTHYLEEIEALSDRVIVIDQGQKLYEGTVHEIRRKVEMQKIEFEVSGSGDLSQIPVLNIERKSQHVTLWTRDSDATLRLLVEKAIGFRHLSVHPASLEEAFIQIRRAGKPDAKLESESGRNLIAKSDGKLEAKSGGKLG